MPNRRRSMLNPIVSEILKDSIQLAIWFYIAGYLPDDLDTHHSEIAQLMKRWKLELMELDLFTHLFSKDGSIRLAFRCVGLTELSENNKYLMNII